MAQIEGGYPNTPPQAPMRRRPPIDGKLGVASIGAAAASLLFACIRSVYWTVTMFADVSGSGGGDGWSSIVLGALVNLSAAAAVALGIIALIRGRGWSPLGLAGGSVGLMVVLGSLHWMLAELFV